jgi:hypothetical protein
LTSKEARRPPQFNELGIRDIKAAEQTPISSNTVRQRVGVPAIVLSTGDAESVSQATKRPGLDHVHGETAIDQRVDNWPVRRFDSHGNMTGHAGDPR